MAKRVEEEKKKINRFKKRGIKTENGVIPIGDGKSVFGEIGKMPVYEYQCRVCGHKLEVLQKSGEDGSNLKCPRCDAKNPQKVFSVFSGSNASSKSSSACSSGSFS